METLLGLAAVSLAAALAWSFLFKVLLVAIYLVWPILAGVAYWQHVRTESPLPDSFDQVIMVILGAYVLLIVFVVLDKPSAGRRPETQAEEPGGAIRVHVVHGTWPAGWLARVSDWFWPRGKRWYELGSDFQSRIKHELGGTVSFTSFCWSGLNSIGERRRASDDFAAFFEEDLGKNSGSRHFIVAHSHGGNVAAQALVDYDLGRHPAVAGMVCMSTPFLWFEGPNAGSIGAAFAGLANLFIAFMYGVACCTGGLVILGGPFLDQLGGLLGSLDTVLFILVATLGCGMAIRSFVRSSLLRSQILNNKVPGGDKLPPVLVIRCSDDTASFGLRASMAARALFTAGWTVLNALFRFRGPWFIKAAKLVAIVITLGVLGSSLGSWTFKWPIQFAKPAWPHSVEAALATIPFGLLGIYFLGSLAATLTAFGVALFLAPAFGPEFLRVPLFCKPVVEDTPLNSTTTVRHLPTEGNTHSTWAHSATPEVIGTWVKGLTS